ncbi:hypothetical protein LOAG_11389 [Loa loa]|uniref:Uncharacterized protein n=1 Tax=Loa loa TaxID=7209 RepID=A0A1S0TN66_LOALO|nr:hypothetical protein LOAG_11389 [Loa loa]EFO17112.1 hypothetical protein LOAG_11389 [Loa loa]
MYFKFWVITVVIAIIFHGIFCSKICSCSKKNQKNDNEKKTNGKSEGHGQNESYNELQSKVCPPPSHCPTVKCPKEKYSKLTPYHTLKTLRLFRKPCPPSNCSVLKCPRLSPPCRRKVCPTL